MSDYIKREDIENAIKSCTRIDGRPLDDYDTMMVYEINDLIDCVPSADVVERKRGIWVHDGKRHKGGCDWSHCSVCGDVDIVQATMHMNFCPNCGADMRTNEAVKTEVLNEQIQC